MILKIMSFCELYFKISAPNLFNFSLIHETDKGLETKPNLNLKLSTFNYVH